MKKTFTFYDLFQKKRLLGLLLLLLICTNSFGQSFCRPVSQTNSVGGVLLCLGLNVSNPANAYDNDAGLATYATITNAVGLGCFAEETLTLNQTAQAGDEIVFYIGTGNGLLDLTLFSNITLQGKLSGTNVGASVALNSPVLNLNLLNGNTVAAVRYTVTAPTNQIQIQAGGLISLLVSLRVYDVRLDFAKPTVTGGLTQTICSGNTASLTAVPAAGTSVAWYSSATSTTPLITGNNFTTPALTANTIYYIGVSRAAGCEGNDRLPVVINVSNPVAPSISTLGTAICSSGATQSTTLSVTNPILETTYNWYTASSGGLPVFTGASYSPTVSLGTTNYFVEASIGACLSPARTQVTVVSTAVPSVPTILTQSVTIQSGQNATLSATTAESGVILNWYEVATGGAAVATNMPTYTTPILTGNKTYYVEAQSATGNCVNPTRVPVLVTVVPSALGGCLEASSQQTVTNGLCLLCTSSNQNNSVDGNPATAARLTLPVGLLNAYIQQTIQFSNPGKAGDIVDVDLELPGGLADLSLLGGVSLATYNGATYNNDRTLITNSLISLQLLSGNRFRASVTAGANFDRVEIRFGAVVTALTNLDIYQATYRYKAPDITGTKTICNGQSATLTAALAVGETVNWYDVATGGTSLAATAAFTTQTLTTATTFYAQITRNGCVNSERTAVLVTVNTPVAPTVIASPTNFCAGQTSTITVQAPVAGTVYNWYDAATGGNLVFTGTSFTTPALTANTSYFVEGTIGSCISATRSQVDLTVNPIPAAPVVASSTVVIPSGQVVTLQVSAPVGGDIYDWYNAATGGTLLASNTTSYTPTPALTANTTFYIAARNATTCVNPLRTAINVIVTPPPVITNCLQAGAQTVSNSGILCVNCGAVAGTEALSIDGDYNTATTLDLPINLGGYVQQRLDFNNPGFAGDIIEVDLGLPTGTLDVSALSYITLESYNASTNNGDAVAVNSSLLNVQLLGGNRFRASFAAGADFVGVQVRLGGLLTALRQLNIYEVSYRFKDATIAGNSTAICAGQPVTLTASSNISGETYNWFDVATGGTAVSTTATYNIPSLTTTTTYYLESTRGTTPCINSNRQPVTVTVNPLATATDVIVTSPIQASCAGGAVIAPTSVLAGATFRYFTAQDKSQEIITGSVVAGQPGATFVKGTDGTLTVSGIPSGASYNYFIGVSTPTICENVINTLSQVTINAPTVTPLVVNANPPAGCGSFNLGTAITGYDPIVNTYTFYDASNNVIVPDAAKNITVAGNYFIQAQSNVATCPSVRQQVTVTINPLPTLTVTSQSVSIGTNVTLTAVSNGSLTWYDPQGNLIAGPPYETGVLNTAGIYNYTVVASNGTCSRTETVAINVIDPNACQSLTERVYATTQTQGNFVTGTVLNPANAVDGNTQTYSTISTGIGLLGIGTTYQDLRWPTTIASGTPVTVKLGSEYSGVTLGQNLTIAGTIGGVVIGNLQPVSGALLNLISGDNSFEYTFIPSNTSGQQAYDGIRIQSASIVSVGQNTKVYDAYYTRPVTTPTCTPGDIEDIYYGATDLGLPVGALTATVGVSNAWNVADNDVTTFATMYSGVSVLTASDLTVAFKTPSIASDTLRIVVSKPAVLLDVTALKGFTIQRYLGNAAVGAPIQNTSSLLTLRVLPGNTMSVVLVSSLPEAYDRVRIRFGGVAGVLDFLRVHTVERVANTKVKGSDINNSVTVCPGTPVTLDIPEESCSTYRWYDAPTGGNLVATGITYTVPMTLAAGTYTYYVQPVRYGCEALGRGELTVVVRASSPVNALTDITLNGATTTSICSPTGTVTLATSLSGTPTLTNPIYYWYRFDGTTGQPVAGPTTNQLIVNGLTPGTYTYFVGVSSAEFCETSETNRKQITFTILPPSTATDIIVDDKIICHDVDAVLTPTTTLANPIFTWYLDANKTQPITNGASINGVTYAISAAGVLTASGLTKALSPISYFTAVSSDTSCENLAGNLQEATIIVSDPGTPTTTDATQEFCLLAAPTFASIQTDQTGVFWYAAATGGTPILSTTALTSGTYYGGLTDSVTNCESSVRLAVVVTVNDPGTPTTADATQDFCLVAAPTVANIQIDTPAVGTIVWYTTATGGTAIPTTTALSNGNYYAAIFDSATNCESAVRFAIAVTVNDPGTPTTADATQEFCLVAAPTVANIQIDTPAVGTIVWYTTATGGTAIPTTTALSNGNYYAAIFDSATNCESAVRFAIAVTVNDPGTPTTADATQEFCLVAAPTVADIQIDTPAVGTIVWYTTATGGTAIPTTTALASGNYYAAIFDSATNCESAVRFAIAVTVNDPGTPTTADATQEFCLVAAPTVANIQIDTPAVGTIVWYTTATGGTAIPTTTALSNGNYYAAIFDSATNCESAVRFAIAVTVNDPGTPTTADATQEFCLVAAPTVANIQIDTPAVGTIVWYTTATGGTAIPTTTALSNGNYYAAIFDSATNCESAVRFAIAVTVNDPGTPTTADATQEFCLVAAPTVADIQIDTPAVGTIVWYTTATGGTAIPTTTALASGNYYASIFDSATNCESAVRFAIAVTVNDPGTPTTADATQEFCLVAAPTVANIQIDTPAVGTIVWYTTATGGTAIPTTTALSNGNYYAAIFDSATNCESAVRFAIAVTVNDPGTPTTADATQEFCLVAAPTVANIQIDTPAVGTIVWYTTATGGTAIPTTTALSNGNYYAAIFDSATNCESAVRFAIAVTVNDPGTPTTADATQEFCLVAAPTVANIQIDTPAVGTIVWYTTATGGTAIPTTTALASGNYYAAIFDSATNCESAVRFAIAVTVNDPGTPTTADATQEFCLVTAPTVANIQIDTPAVGTIVWYTTATGGTAIPTTTALSNGNYYAAIFDSATNCESAVRFAIAVTVNDPGTPTTADATQDFCLVAAPTVANIQIDTPAVGTIVWYTTATGGTAIPTTTALSNGNYYAAIFDSATNCESAVRFAIAVTVNDPGTPTTADATQEFCLVTAPTVANIQIDTPAVGTIVWYTTATGGTAIPTTTALASGNYYAAIFDFATNCESAVRFAIAVTVNDPGTPTTADSTQDFCLVNAPTFASIQTNETNVVWYNAVTGGTAIPAATALTSGTYYAALLDAVTNCESNVRLAITISVTDPATPTTTDTTQDFCLVNAPTFASIQTNETNVVWYNAATGGTAIPATTALTSGTYYAALLDAVTNCESSVRLAITISVTDPGTPTTTDSTQDFCLVNAPTFASIQTNETNIVWYATATGGTAIPATTALTSGTYYAALLDPVTNCESDVRLAITISVTDPGTPTTTDTTQDFCLVNAPTFASIQTNETNVVWYNAVTGGTAIPAATALTSGTYYAALLDAVTNCESNVRLAITISVTDPATPTTTDTTQDFCLVNAPTFASIQTNETNVVWYNAATGGTAIPATTALTSGTYYAALLDAVTNCESSVRLAVTISVTDPGTPTTTDTTQDFCLVNAPTFASIQTNETNVVWYATATGGTAIPATTALTSGTYYAALLDPVTNCESDVRLAITISVTDPGTPTTTDTTQDFCLVNAPTFASIQTNETNVVWYATATGGTAIPATTALTSGTYYAALLDATTNCESSVRLAITISVTDPATPTTTDTTQDFCLVNAPTFASIQTNETNVVWYNAATGGTAIPATTALTSGTYYAALLDAVTNCESSVRLAVTISVTDPGTPTTTDTTQDFCLVNAPTFASIQTNEINVVWYATATGGTAIPATTALTSGTYYAALLDSVTNCESDVRLAITISVTDPGTPTTTDTTQDFCLVNAPTFASIQTNETNIVWYNAATGGTAITAATALTSGTYYAALLDAVTNCESNVRLAITISVTDPATPTTTDSTQDFCLVNAPTFASIQTNETNVVWYATATGGTAIPATTALTSGTYYASLLDAVTNCESSVRLAITISVTDPGTPTTTDTTQDFCLVNAPTFASIQTNEINVVWYATATGGTAIPATTALTSGTYYAALLDSVTNCESDVRLAITISVTDPGTPTTTDTTQDFCLVNAPTFASIQTNETNVVWYNAVTGGTAIPAATALTSGTYYAALLDAVTNCESNVRLAITISVTDPATPTTTDTTQDFCLVNAPTFASIQTNETNVVWYATATGGTAIPATTALTSGTYYASLLDAVTNCESSVRLAITISVTDPGTPTTTDTTQDFCLVNAPTFASIQTNETNVVWYATATGGTAIPATTALTSGTYYAALLDATNNCESNVRLAVTISVTDPGTPTTTDTTQDFCLVNAPTFASIQTNETNVVWYTAATGGTAIPATTALTSGTYYATLLDAVTNCESNVRLAITISVTNPVTPTTTAAAQTFCSGTNPTVASIQVNEANVVWYATATGGTVIPSTTALGTGVYYGAIKDPATGCESNVRLVVTITVGNTVNPTTNNVAQTFCSVNAPTFASIQVNEPNVVWYTASTGGTAIPATTALTSGTYFGNIIDPLTSCESTTRLQVVVTVTNPSATPTTTDVTQDFCSLNGPKVLDIQVNETNVIWYATATGGTAIPANTALTSGSYYGVISSASGCENPVRLLVAVTVNTPGIITTPRTTQTFCLSALPTLADILVNETNVVFYTSATGGTPLAGNTPLTATTYYAGALNNTLNGCESATRLGITIAFENDALVQLTSTDDTPCVFQGVTYSIANGKSNYVWSITNGTITSGGGTSDGSVTVSWSDIGAGTVSVTYVNTCNETTTKTLNVTVATCSDLTITNTVDNPAPNFGDNVTFTVTVNNVGEGSFINTIVSDLLPSGYDLVSASTTLGTYDNGTQLWTIPTLNAGQSVTLTIVAQVLPSGNYLNVATVEISTPLDADATNNSASALVVPICLTVYNEFTPNNDGANDLFRIDCIETHPNNELKVFNRYGALVYSKAHYENDWDGTANVSGVVNRGDMLPTGTYFYVITIGDGTVKKGWLSIMR